MGTEFIQLRRGVWFSSELWVYNTLWIARLCMKERYFEHPDLWRPSAVTLLCSCSKSSFITIWLTRLGFQALISNLAPLCWNYVGVFFAKWSVCPYFVLALLLGEPGIGSRRLWLWNLRLRFLGTKRFPWFKSSGEWKDAGRSKRSRKHRCQNLFAHKREEPGSTVSQLYVQPQRATHHDRSMSRSAWPCGSWADMAWRGGRMVQLIDWLYVHGTGNNYKSLQCYGDNLVLGCRALIALWVLGDIFIFVFKMGK